jgi:hypothetical protein
VNVGKLGKDTYSIPTFMSSLEILPSPSRPAVDLPGFYSDIDYTVGVVASSIFPPNCPTAVA